MTLEYFTLIHILISLIGIASGFGMLAGLLFDRLFSRWTTVFLITTLLTSVTGFFFPFKGITPAIVVGIISVVLLIAACFALYVRRLENRWRSVFVATSVTSLYFNCFVIVAQLFQKTPALIQLAPTQTEPPFAVTQKFVLIAFVILGVSALRRFRNSKG